MHTLKWIYFHHQKLHCAIWHQHLAGLHCHCWCSWIQPFFLRPVIMKSEEIYQRHRSYLFLLIKERGNISANSWIESSRFCSEKRSYLNFGFQTSLFVCRVVNKLVVNISFNYLVLKSVHIRELGFDWYNQYLKSLLPQPPNTPTPFKLKKCFNSLGVIHKISFQFLFNNWSTGWYLERKKQDLGIRTRTKTINKWIKWSKHFYLNLFHF